jgi:predicted membrane chloride channel (bestrophin family)
MLGILSTMLSFALSLRSSSALERWNSGRQAWTQMNTGSRNLAMLIWLHYPSTTLTAPEVAELQPNSEQMEVEGMKAIIEKRTMIG